MSQRQPAHRRPFSRPPNSCRRVQTGAAERGEQPEPPALVLGRAKAASGRGCPAASCPCSPSPPCLELCPLRPGTAAGAAAGLTLDGCDLAEGDDIVGKLRAGMGAGCRQPGDGLGRLVERAGGPRGEGRGAQPRPSGQLCRRAPVCSAACWDGGTPGTAPCSCPLLMPELTTAGAFLFLP